MTVTPPPVHVPRPYERPHANLACRVDVPCEDGAVVAAFVYAPHGVRDQPGTPFGIDPHVPPVLMLHGNGEEHGIFGPTIDAVTAAGRSVVAIDSRAQGESTRGHAPLSYELMACLPAPPSTTPPPSPPRPRPGTACTPVPTRSMRRPSSS